MAQILHGDIDGGARRQRRIERQSVSTGYPEEGAFPKAANQGPDDVGVVEEPCTKVLQCMQLYYMRVQFICYIQLNN